MAVAKGFVLDLHQCGIVVDPNGGLFATCMKYIIGV